MLTWVLESSVFEDGHARLKQAARNACQKVITWDDDWWSNGEFPDLSTGAVVFHGSLGNAARVRAELPWAPGAFCNTEAFVCSAWYPKAREWLVHTNWCVRPANEFVRDPDAALSEIGGARDDFFVRPDSPLKPFSGRVLSRESVSLEALDHGFYYDDESIPIVVAPIAAIGAEWRFVVVDRIVVASCRYEAEGRSESVPLSGGAQWDFAQEIAHKLTPPDVVYTLDICESDGGLRLLELNPFSGADLYACDRSAIVVAVGKLGV
ncbi:MAG: ATP-grasp domain-containing protein [Candidatus Nealsonbacteria bacterium]|nr:ATP-grasp domain-containing protein [Candidatus Nealsonbacteria bacterium]